MLQAETIHRYPRITTWLIELLCTLAVALSTFNMGLLLLRCAWLYYGFDNSLYGRLPFLRNTVAFVNRWSGTLDVRAYGDLLPLLMSALGWLALALLLAVLLRNAFPVIRTSSRGLLVEFAGSWLPVRWEALKTIKVTEDLAAERFVLLAQTDGSELTGWHRFYSLVYNFGLRRAFLITSNISEFDKLVQSVLSETERAARAGDMATPARLEEQAWSPLFRFLLSPGAFFSRRALSEKGAEGERPLSAQAAAQAESVRGSYPFRITALFVWGSALLALLTLWQYLVYWGRFLALVVPRTRRFWPFSEMVLTTAEAQYPWMQLVAAHLLLLLMLSVLMVLRNILPALEVRPEGLRVGYFGRWLQMPWTSISAIKATEFSEQSQIILFQTRSKALPHSFRLSSLLYEGGLAPGVLLTSAISNFEPLLQRALLYVTQAQQGGEPSEDSEPLLRNDAHSWLLALAFQPGPAIDRLVAEAREQEETKQFLTGPTLRAAGRMFALALPVALLPLFGTVLGQALPPGPGTLARIILLLLLGMIEWPLVALLAPTLDEMTGGGEEGQRPLYLYPTVQLPRLLAIGGALVLFALRVPVLPIIVWLAALGWSFMLAAGLWEALYSWKGSQLLLGGLVPVAYQMIVLLVFLATQ